MEAGEKFLRGDEEGAMYISGPVVKRTILPTARWSR